MKTFRDHLAIARVARRLIEVAPPGWEGTVKAMKKHPDIDNPWALAHSMKNKGMQSHIKATEDTHAHYAGEFGSGPAAKSLDNKKAKYVQRRSAELTKLGWHPEMAADRAASEFSQGVKTAHPNSLHGKLRDQALKHAEKAAWLAKKSELGPPRGRPYSNQWPKSAKWGDLPGGGNRNDRRTSEDTHEHYAGEFGSSPSGGKHELPSKAKKEPRPGAKIDPDNDVHWNPSNPHEHEFAKAYLQAERAHARGGEPKVPLKNLGGRAGFAGSGHTIYRMKMANGEHHDFRVDRHANGKSFYGTTHAISHIGPSLMDKAQNPDLGPAAS